jgi:ubiquinone/menaquinone biosynthesis C-methylase UbiE
MRGLQALYRHPLTDLGDVLGENYRGIFSPGYDDALLGQYLNPQFTTDSDWYVDHSDHSEFSGRLLKRCFVEAGRDTGAWSDAPILDIGSGAGNSIFPLLDSFREQRVIASDLSPQMLLALKRGLAQRPAHPGLHLLQLNAENPDFHDGTFQLVVGMAILHHLLDPSRAIREVARILQPGGLAIFSEPFENGNYLLSLAYRMILRDHAAVALPVRLRQFLQGRIEGTAARAGLEKSQAFLQSHDDKWLFTRGVVEKLAKESGFSRCLIMPVAQKADVLSRKTRALLRYQQLDLAELPEWGWDIIREVESGMSGLLRPEMPLEAAIILEK